MMKNDEIIAVVQSHTAGKVIQYRTLTEALIPTIGFTDCAGEPLWDFSHYLYRAKPEPREWIVHEFRGEIASDGGSDVMIKVREVLEVSDE